MAGGLMPMSMQGKATGRMGGGAMPPDEAPMEAEGEGGEAATPEEQALYEKVVGKAMELVYSKMFDQVIQMLRGGDPVEALAETASMVIFRVVELAAKAGQPIPTDIGLQAGQEIFEDLASLADKSGGHPFEQDQKATEAAFYRTIDKVRLLMEKHGMIDPAKAKQTLGQLQDMDRSGDLGRGLEKLQKRGATPAAEAESPDMSPEDGEI